MGLLQSLRRLFFFNRCGNKVTAAIAAKMTAVTTACRIYSFACLLLRMKANKWQMCVFATIAASEIQGQSPCPYMGFAPRIQNPPEAEAILSVQAYKFCLYNERIISNKNNM